ncbi:hypothetical protein P9112_000574 [Eukaryota sp. TZLM1-RC]
MPPRRSTSSASTKKTKTSDDREYGSWDISSKRKVKVRSFRGSLLVDIREYYKDRTTGEEKAGSKGISLTWDQYTELLKVLPQVTDTLENAVDDEEEELDLNEDES